MNTLVIDGKSFSVECCLETKMRRDVKLLYDVMADTIGYTCLQAKMSAASLLLARIHARFARDEIINSLCSAFREELTVSASCSHFGIYCTKISLTKSIWYKCTHEI